MKAERQPICSLTESAERVRGKQGLQHHSSNLAGPSPQPRPMETCISEVKVRQSIQEQTERPPVLPSLSVAREHPCDRITGLPLLKK